MQHKARPRRPVASQKKWNKTDTPQKYNNWLIYSVVHIIFLFMKECNKLCVCVVVAGNKTSFLWSPHRSINIKAESQSRSEESPSLFPVLHCVNWPVAGSILQSVRVAQASEVRACFASQLLLMKQWGARLRLINVEIHSIHDERVPTVPSLWP